MLGDQIISNRKGLVCQFTCLISGEKRGGGTKGGEDQVYADRQVQI